MTLGRPSSFQRDAVREQLMQHFWQHGYQRSATRDLLAASGLSASSLYRSFGRKDAVFVECLTHYTDSLRAQLATQWQASPSARNFLQHLFQQTAAQAGTPAARLGCLIVNSVAELGPDDGPCAERTRHSLAQLQTFFRRVLNQACGDGDLPPGSDTALQADLLVTQMIGLRTRLKAGLTKQRAQLLANSIINGLFTPEETEKETEQ